MTLAPYLIRLLGGPACGRQEESNLLPRAYLWEKKDRYRKTNVRGNDGAYLYAHEHLKIIRPPGSRS